MKYFLAIDQSTSATKAILFDQNGAEIAQESADHKQIYPQPGYVEHDAEEIWQNVCLVIKKLLAAHPDKKPESISISNQRETFVLFDRATGLPIRNAIVWQCRSGAAVCEQIKKAGQEPTVIVKTGLPLDTYFSASKLAQLLKDKPAIRGHLADGNVRFGTIDTYLIYRLTGCDVFATDFTNASRTLLFDISTRKWDKQLCSLFDVPMNALPEVRDSTASYGKVDPNDAPGIPAIPIVGVMGDSQAALFAQCCYSQGAAKVTFGTGSSILLNTGDKYSAGPQGICTTLAWVHQDQPTYCYEGIINYSAATVAWLKDQLGLINSPQETEGLARSVPDNGGVYLVPAFVGLSAPYWEPHARASITGMTSQAGKAHIVRAALESIGYQIADILDVMTGSAGTKIKSIHADGGPTRNPFIMQFVADMTGVELAVSSVPNCSALGAAMAGMIGTGAVAGINDLAKLPREKAIYKPSMPAEQVKTLRAGWDKAVARTLLK